MEKERNARVAILGGNGIMRNIPPEERVAWFLYTNKVKEVSVASLLDTTKEELGLYDVEDNDLIIELLAILIEEDYESALNILKKSDAMIFETPTPIISDEMFLHNLSFDICDDICKGNNPYIKNSKSYFDNPSQNAKKYYKRKRFF